MGFNGTKHIKIVFEPDHELHGLEVTIKSSNLDRQKAYVRNYPQGDNADKFAQMEYAGKHFLAHVVGWNLEDDDGDAVPITWEGLERALDLTQITALVTAYTANAIGSKASTDTEKKSGTGDDTEITPSTEASLPMETLPRRPVSTSKP